MVSAMTDLSPYFAIMSARPDDVVTALKKDNTQSLHVTNGAYVPAAKILVPTTVAGFQYLHDTHPDKSASMLVAINSNKSMRDALEARNAPGAEFDALEDQYARARKFIPLLTAQFPERRVIMAFYDEQDPVALYGTIDAAGIPIRTLHKWGYGTGDNPKPILGAEFAQSVYGYPFASATEHMRPAFWDVTPEGQKGSVKIVDLTKAAGPHGRAYLSDDNKLLFPVASQLKTFAADTAAAPGPKAP